MLRLIQKGLIGFFCISIVLFILAVWKNASIADNSGPEITMNTDSVTISISGDESDILDGITATDRKDGDVTDSLVVENLSNFIEKGRRQATIVAFDSNNNVVKATREVIYNDYYSPRFSLSEPLRYPINHSGSPIGTLTVVDCIEGDLTNNITVVSENQTDVDTSQAGSYTLDFQVINNAGDIVDLPVTVEYYDSKDNACPKVMLSDYLIYTSVGSSIDPWQYIVGVTYQGRELSLDDMHLADSKVTLNDIQVLNPVDVNTPGVYEIVYSIEGEDSYQSHVRLIVIVEE